MKKRVKKKLTGNGSLKTETKKYTKQLRKIYCANQNETNKYRFNAFKGATSEKQRTNLISQFITEDMKKAFAPVLSKELETGNTLVNLVNKSSVKRKTRDTCTVT